MSAQRYPDDFNGIVAAAPTLQWTQIMMKGLWNRAALEGSGLTTSNMTYVFKTVSANCDAQDGLKDGLIDDPRQCRFDPARDVPRCAAGSEGAECLTNRQVEVLQLIYSGPKTSRGAAFVEVGDNGVAIGLRRMLCAPSCWRSAHLMDLRGVCESKTSLVSSVATTETLEE